jgi:fluoroacetyl-CoA thioesterase
MKRCIEVGHSITECFVVTEAMRPQFDGFIIHQVYSTPAMLTHFEWLTRKLLLPYLDTGEEGAGFEMHLKHIAPTPLGATVEVTASIVGLRKNRLQVSCTARYQEKIVGIGHITAGVVQKDRMTL